MATLRCGSSTTRRICRADQVAAGSPGERGSRFPRSPPECIRCGSRRCPRRAGPLDGHRVIGLGGRTRAVRTEGLHDERPAILRSTRLPRRSASKNRRMRGTFAARTMHSPSRAMIAAYIASAHARIETFPGGDERFPGPARRKNAGVSAAGPRSPRRSGSAPRRPSCRPRCPGNASPAHAADHRGS